jgi:hypothetical protein
MPAIIRCMLCGKDHPYARYAEGRRCDECEQPLKADTIRVIIKRPDDRPADPLEFQ